MAVVGVSAVVPAFNGGDDLRALLTSLFNQRGVDLDVVVLDSGGNEGVRDGLPSGVPVRWETVDPGTFSHSATRLRGVELARHPLVFLTVQDARLNGETDLAEAARRLQQDNLSVLSWAETPRPDADAYARFALASYLAGLFPPDQGTAVHDAWQGSRTNRIAAATVNHVASLYPRDVLRHFGLRGRFGEDFDLAARLLQAGHRVGKTRSITVTHSHTRPAFYVLQRGWLSHRLLASHGVGEPDGRSEDELLAGLRSLTTAWTDPRLVSLWQRLDIPAGGVGGEPWQQAPKAALDWEPSGPAQAVFREKVLSWEAGWRLGARELGAWSPGRRAVLESLGEGV